MLLHNLCVLVVVLKKKKNKLEMCYLLHVSSMFNRYKNSFLSSIFWFTSILLLSVHISSHSLCLMIFGILYCSLYLGYCIAL